MSHCIAYFDSRGRESDSTKFICRPADLVFQSLAFLLFMHVLPHSHGSSPSAFNSFLSLLPPSLSCWCYNLVLFIASSYVRMLLFRIVSFSHPLAYAVPITYPFLPIFNGGSVYYTANPREEPIDRFRMWTSVEPDSRRVKCNSVAEAYQCSDKKCRRHNDVTFSLIALQHGELVSLYKLMN